MYISRQSRESLIGFQRTYTRELIVLWAFRTTFENHISERPPCRHSSQWLWVWILIRVYFATVSGIVHWVPSDIYKRTYRALSIPNRLRKRHMGHSPWHHSSQWLCVGIEIHPFYITDSANVNWVPSDIYKRTYRALRIPNNLRKPHIGTSTMPQFVTMDLSLKINPCKFHESLGNR